MSMEPIRYKWFIDQRLSMDENIMEHELRARNTIMARELVEKIEPDKVYKVLVHIDSEKVFDPLRGWGVEISGRIDMTESEIVNLNWAPKLSMTFWERLKFLFTGDYPLELR